MILGPDETHLEVGETYLLFLESDPFWTTCPEQTAAQVVGDRVTSLDRKRGSFWTTDSLTEIGMETKSVVTSNWG